MTPEREPVQLEVALQSIAKKARELASDRMMPNAGLWSACAEEAEAALASSSSSGDEGPVVRALDDERAYDLIMRAVSLLSNLLMESPKFSIPLHDLFFGLRDDMRQWLVDQADAALALATSPQKTSDCCAAPRR